MGAAAAARHAGDSRADDPRVGKLGFALFLASLGMLFATSLVGYLVVRLRADAWPPPGLPGLPIGLWFGTGVLLLSSGTVAWASRSVRAGKLAVVGPAMALTWALGVAFLIVQIVNWSSLLRAEMTMHGSMYGFTFFMLTGLHALHVIGGLIPIGWVSVRALRGAYTAGEHRGITYSAMYWHFLDAVWLVMFAALVIAA